MDWKELLDKIISWNEEDRFYAVQMLGKKQNAEEKDEAIAHLSDALEDENLRVREEAAKQLAKFKDIRILNILLKAASRNRNEKIRSYAIEALGNLGDRKAVMPLIELLDYERDTRIMLKIVFSLDKLGTKDFEKFPYEFLANSRNPKIRNYKIGSLYYYYKVLNNPKRRIDIKRSYRKYLESNSDVEDFNNLFLIFVEKEIEDEEDEYVRKELAINCFELNDVKPEWTLNRWRLNSELNAHDFLMKHSGSGVNEAISDFERTKSFLQYIVDIIVDIIESKLLEEQISKSIAMEIEEFNSKFVYNELTTKFREYRDEFVDNFSIQSGTHYDKIFFNYVNVFKFLDNPNFLSLIIELHNLGQLYPYDISGINKITEKALNQIDKKTKIKNALILLIKGMKYLLTQLRSVTLLGRISLGGWFINLSPGV